MTNEEERREILTRFHILHDIHDAPLEIGADSVTTPYDDNNA